MAQRRLGWFDRHRHRRNLRQHEGDNGDDASSSNGSAHSNTEQLPCATETMISIPDVSQNAQWAPEIHKYYTPCIRREIKLVLLIKSRCSRDQRSSTFASLPNELLLKILQYIAGNLVCEFWPVTDEVTWKPYPAEITLKPPRDSCNTLVLTFGLGCTTSYPGHLSTGIKVLPYNFCFHPGYHSGAFRGPINRKRTEDTTSIINYSNNQNMGFTPAQNILHSWHIVLKQSGLCQIRIVNKEDSNESFNHAWIAEKAMDQCFNGSAVTISISGCDEAIIGNLRVYFL